MRWILAHFLCGVVWIGFNMLMWTIGSIGSKAPSEQIPVTVRDNPASYKPSLTKYTGWTAKPVPTSSGGGGYSHGK